MSGAIRWFSNRGPVHISEEGECEVKCEVKCEVRCESWNIWGAEYMSSVL